jgi:hypothetical protein
MAGTECADIVGHLNSLLRGEISAVETYRTALASVKVPTASTELTECMHSHERRVMKLRNRIVELGGTPVESSGVWGTFAKLVQESADVLGARLAIAALEEGEDRGVADYRKAMPDLDEQSRDLLEQELLPAQMRTRRAMSSLRHALQ